MALRVVSSCVTLRVPYDRLDPALAAARALVSRGHRVVLDLTPPGAADLRLVDALARLDLLARRSGGELRARSDEELGALVRLCGLAAVLSGQGGLEPDLGEDLRADEVVDVGDPAG